LVTKKEIENAIIKSGLSGKLISLHSSLKSFGYVDGGADTVIQSFIGLECTLVVPAFYYAAQVRPPEGTYFDKNAFVESEYPVVSDENIIPYNACPEMITKDMGSIPARVIRMKESIRGNHPICSFAAVGPKSREIIQCQKPLEVYAPYRKLYENGGYLLLMGTDLTKATPIHYAEQLAGRNLFRRWIKVGENNIEEAEVGSCSDGFNNFNIHVKGIENMVKVGDSLWRIYPFKEFIDSAVKAIINNPAITHCGNKECLRCDNMIMGGPQII
jgi:aminoglycoside 3-N-acetyltransferase